MTDPLKHHDPLPTERRNELGQLIICGSMAAISAMEAIAAQLRNSGVHALPPHRDSEVSGKQATTLDEKRAASKLHFSWIMDSATRAILVVNPDRAGQPSYIGPNAFAEIAVAFALDRSVYLYNQMPDNYREELQAWEAHCLNGDLTAIVDFFHN